MKENSISYLHQLIAELPKVLFGTYLCKARGLPFSPSAADVLLPTEVSGPGPVLYKLLRLCKLHGGRAPAKQLLQPLWGLERQDTGWLKPRQLCVWCPPISCFSCLTTCAVSTAPGCQITATSPASIPNLTATSACCYRIWLGRQGCPTPSIAVNKN